LVNLLLLVALLGLCPDSTTLWLLLPVLELAQLLVLAQELLRHTAQSVGSTCKTALTKPVSKLNNA